MCTVWQTGKTDDSGLCGENVPRDKWGGGGGGGGAVRSHISEKIDSVAYGIKWGVAYGENQCAVRKKTHRVHLSRAQR